LAPYCATKAFNDFFSRALALEFGHALDVLSLRPGYVVSNMSKLTQKGGFVLDRYECASGCLEKLGHVKETYGDPRHAVYARSFFLLPEFILSRRRRKRLEEKNAAIQLASASSTSPLYGL
jgi:short-subunit dehydrogenase